VAYILYLFGSFYFTREGSAMRSSKNNERELLKCLHELTQAVDRISYLIEDLHKEKKHKDNHEHVIGQIRGNVAALREKFSRLDIRIGRT
jgi:hypothetical protein